MEEKDGWRSGLECITVYKRRFAFFKRNCVGGEKVWLKWYYSKYHIWTHSHSSLTEYGHTDFVGNITEADFIVEKLTNI